MKPKKSFKADLENRKGIFIQLGLVVTLSLTLIAFEWTNLPDEKSEITLNSVITYEDEIISTQREETPPEESEQALPDLVDVFELVDDDVVVPDVDFSSEVDEHTTIDFRNYGNDEVIEEDDKPFVVVEEMPLFNGGEPAVEFRKYIMENLKYPAIAQENGVGGKVYVQFIVNEQGNIVDAKILLPLDPALDQEALRVVNSSPAWTPGKQRGKPAKVIYTFPINFVLR